MCSGPELQRLMMQQGGQPQGLFAGGADALANAESAKPKQEGRASLSGEDQLPPGMSVEEWLLQKRQRGY